MKVSEKVAAAKLMGGISNAWRDAGFKNYAEAQRAAFVARYGIPRLIEEMDNGKLLNTCGRIARCPPEQQLAILEGKAPLPPLKGEARHVKDWTMTPGDMKAGTFMEKVEAIMQDIKKGRGVDECCARYSVGRDAYQRCRLVAKRGHAPLIEAVNKGVVTPGETELLMKLDDAALAAKIEELTVAHETVKADPRSRKGNFNVDSLRSLLQRSYVEWRGVSFNVKINAKILPTTESGLGEMRREAMNCRNAVNMVLDSLEKEIARTCLHRTAASNGFSTTSEWSGSTETTTLTPS